MSSSAEHDTAGTAVDHSDDIAVGPEVDDLSAARAQLRARAGARGRRSSRPGRGAGGQGQVKAGSCFRDKSLRRLDFIAVGPWSIGGANVRQCPL